MTSRNHTTGDCSADSIFSSRNNVPRLIGIRSRWIPLLACLGLQAVGSGFSQEKKPDESDTKDDQPIVLSPFVVDASQDQGYRATSTLAGSRINTALKDVAAPITVVTKEFIDDLAAVNINDVVAYTVGTEGSRSYSANDIQLGAPRDTGAESPNTANRVRGLYSADITRDYFYTISTWVGFDSYNLDQITINRGPNSALAGLGSPAGIINYSPQLAGLAKNHNEVTYRFGSFGDQRTTFNSNLVAKKDVLAFRLAAAYSDRGLQQQPAWNKDKRIYGAFTYQPWSKTTIRGSYEVAKVDSNNPNTITPEDDVSQWVALGKPSYDRNSSAPVDPALWQDGNLTSIFYNKSGALEGAQNLNTGYYFAQKNIGNVGLWVSPRMNSNKYLQLDKMNLSPSSNLADFRAINFSVDQEIFRDLHANVAYTRETYQNDGLQLFRAEYSSYYVDVNVRTPTGALNPHYGETYMGFRGLDNRTDDHNTNEVLRGTLTYHLDLTKYNKWFGHYRMTGFVEDRETETNHRQYTARSNKGSTNQQEIGYRYYLGGTATTRATTVPGHPGLVTDVTNTYFDGASGSFLTDQLNSFYLLKSDNWQLTKLASSAFVTQAYFWDDKIVGMYGIRRDVDKAGFNGSVDDAGTPATHQYGTLSELSAQTKTYGVVVHPLKWLSVHYNRAENFIPNAGSVDLLGKATPKPTGAGKDYGFSVNLFDDKLVAKVNWFELTAASGAADNANFPVAQWTLPFQELVVMPELAAKAGVVYKKAMAPDLVVGDARLLHAYTSDNVSKGLEVELTYNVSKNWRIMGSVSKQEAKQTNIASGLTSFIEERLAYWKSVPGLWTGQRTSNNPWGLQQTGEEFWNQFSNGYYVGYKAADGKPSIQLAKWHASGLTNYTFTEGPLKGFSIGGGARYIEKSVIGNPAITNAAGLITGLDLAHPYYSGGYISFDAWIGYTTKVSFFGDKKVLSFQLNGRDLEQSGGFRPIAANSDGAHSVYRIVQPRTFYLTTKLEF